MLQCTGSRRFRGGSVSTDRLLDPVQAATLKYTLYRVLKTSGFATPFVVVFMVGNGVTYTDIGIGTTVMAVVVVGAEVPSGYIADRFGRRATVFAGQLFGALGATGYLVARSTATVVLLYVAFGLAVAVQSGSELAWFYDTLERHDAADRYEEIESRFGSIVNYLKATTMLVGAGLFVVEPAAAVVAGAVANWAGTLVVVSFPKEGEYGDADRVGVRESVGIVRRFLTSDAVRTVVAVGALYAGGTYAASKFVQPTTLSILPDDGVTLGPIGVPAPVFLGVLYAVYALVSGVAVSYGATARDRFGVGGTVLLAYGSGALCMVLPLAFTPLALPAMVLFMTVPSLAGPAVGGYLNRHTESMARATVMSGVSFVQAVVRMPILLVSGYVADLQSPTVAMAGIGLGVLGLGAGAILLDYPVTIAQESSAETAD